MDAATFEDTFPEFSELLTCIARAGMDEGLSLYLARRGKRSAVLGREMKAVLNLFPLPRIAMQQVACFHLPDDRTAREWVEDLRKTLHSWQPSIMLNGCQERFEP
jgi:hypothetical protein